MYQIQFIQNNTNKIFILDMYKNRIYTQKVTSSNHCIIIYKKSITLGLIS